MYFDGMDKGKNRVVLNYILRCGCDWALEEGQRCFDSILLPAVTGRKGGGMNIPLDRWSRNRVKLQVLRKNNFWNFEFFSRYRY